MKKKIWMILYVLLSTLVMGEESVVTEGENKKPFHVDGKKYIIRPMFGYSTSSDFGEIITAQGTKKDPNESRLYGVMVERYVFKDINDFPVDVTLFGGFLVHTNSYHSRSEQNNGKDRYYYENKNSNEVNFGIKLYWKLFPWSKYVRTRAGLGEGISICDRVPNIEKSNQYNKQNSKYLNYIDLTFALNARDITRIEQLETTYIGVGISHRSGIFGTIHGVVGGGNNIVVFVEMEL